MTEKDERSGDWQAALEKPQQFEIDHPVYRNAPKIAIAIGTACGIAMAIFSDTPWWMPIFIGVVATVMINRILRPRTRGYQIEDEI